MIRLVVLYKLHLIDSDILVSEDNLFPSKTNAIKILLLSICDFCRTITVEDYMFTPELVKELKPAGMYNYSNGTSNPDKTQVLYKYKPILL